MLFRSDMSNGATSIGGYFTDMLDPSMNWKDVEAMVEEWDGEFCLKGIMSKEDARRAIEIGCTGIVISNHRSEERRVGKECRSRWWAEH